MTLPKVLITAPTASAKNYCFAEWIENVMNFTYPFFEVRLYDNTNDGGANAKYLNEYVRKNHCAVGFDQKFYCENSFIKNNVKPSSSVIENMCLSHNDCRYYALKNGYEYTLHLETDVFPPADIIESLMVHNKLVTGAVYYRDEGIYRKAMIQRRLTLSSNNFKTMNFEPNEEIFFMDGSLKEAAHIGLGCVLIEKTVFEKIPFRFVKNQNMHPDSFFAEDCFRSKIKIYVDTSIICRHENQSWTWVTAKI